MAQLFTLFAAKDLRRLGWRSDSAELHVNVMDASNDLASNGTAPVGLLSVSRSVVFTHPDDTRNKMPIPPSPEALFGSGVTKSVVNTEK
ncbi:MAG: hypothetical protein WCI94_10415 [Rhodospirillales bacterium]